MADYSSTLFPQHREMLRASGVSPEQAHARGYRSVDSKTRLEAIDVARPGRLVPGLLVPSHRADGSVWGYQYRPDTPRLRDGRPVKYETPVGQRNGIDVPPGVGEKLGDPSVPLWVTEGVKKADAAACAGLACVALPGVWSWRGKNALGGKTALPEWHDIALEGRRVVLAFDGDVARKPAVRHALTSLAGYLETKGAHVEYCHLPDEDDKVGLDDYLVAGHTAADLLGLVHPDLPPARAETLPVSPVQPVTSVAPDRNTGTAGETGGVPPVDLEGVLDDVRAWLARFIRTMSEADLDLLALWAVHTHLCLETYTTPRLVLDSPVPGSGKTTVLDHLNRLCRKPVQAASLSSPALLARMLDDGVRTVLIDEADRSLDPKKDGVGELLAVINAGYRRGAQRPVLVPGKEGKWNVSEMSVFAPVAMAGNNPALPEDTRQRCIRVLLLPDLTGQIEESDWEVIEPEAQALGARVTRWADHVRENVRTTRPPLPAGITGRDREKWSPLKRVAVLAGGTWPERVDEMAKHDKEQTEMDREDGMIREKPALLLLRHMHELWPAGEAFVATTNLCDVLAFTHPDEWGDGSPFGKAITPQRLGRMLATSYKVNTTRRGGTGPRGYVRAHLAPIWERMGIVAPPPEAPPVSPPVRSTPTGETGGTGGTVGTGGAETWCFSCGEPLTDQRAAQTAVQCPECEQADVPTEGED